MEERKIAMKRKVSKTKIIVAIIGVLLLAAIFAFLLYGDNLQLFKEFFRGGITQEEIREIAQRFGVRGIISIGLLSMLQVVMMFLPAEPVQVVAGVSYGLGYGLLICTAGVLVGNTIIYICYKVFGTRMREYYSKKVDLDFSSAKTVRGISLVVLIMYILPAIPYGMICFFAASMGLKYPRYIILTVLGSIPSILIGVALGHLAITASIIWAAVVFVILIVIIIIIMIKKDKLTAKLNEFIKRKNTPYTSDTEVRKPNKFLYTLFVFVCNIYLAFKFKVKFKSTVKKIEKSSIVLVNHGSFIDFMYSMKFLRRYYPHVITARMYFYHKFMGSMMKKGGIIPKSMFTADLENAKNCVRVIKNKEMLLMMPEARLSTVGRYEGIQDVTAKFVHKSGVNVYLMKLHGDYFAMPKWGDGARRRAKVECTLTQLYSAEELANTDFDTFKKSLDEAMYYDEYEWLATRPELKYKKKTLAEGLEGVLYKCPECGSECTGETSGRKIRCTACGMEAELDSRYGFIGNKPFANIRDWYDWQYSALEKEIASDENYALVSKVKLKHSSKDGKKCLRDAGEGVCKLDKSGLTYKGTDDGEEVEVHFNGNQVYRLLFGVNEDFEIYLGKEIYYFVPEDRRSCVKWYLCSTAFKDYFKG